MTEVSRFRSAAASGGVTRMSRGCVRLRSRHRAQRPSATRPRANRLMERPAAVSGPTPTTALEVFGADDIVGYRRSPSDVMRLILFGLATVALLTLTRWAEGTVVAFENDIVALFGSLNSSVEHALNQTLSIAAGIVSVAVLVPALLRKRY